MNIVNSILILWTLLVLIISQWAMGMLFTIVAGFVIVVFGIVIFLTARRALASIPAPIHLFALMSTVALVGIVMFLQWSDNLTIEGRSISPGLEDGDRVLIDRFAYSIFGKPKQNDIVIFAPPTGGEVNFVKRLIGTPGDEVDINSGRVFVNDVRSTSIDTVTDARAFFNFPITVPEGEFFVLGDNRRQTNDSRNWGWVDSEAIHGKVVFIYWPLNRVRFVR